MLNVYKASAGSGKTFRLAYEYIKALLGRRISSDNATSNAEAQYRFYDNYSNPHRRILAVTFTNKATAEMKNRIIEELDILAHNPDQSNYMKKDCNLCKDFSCDTKKIERNATLVLQQLLHDFSYFNVSTIDSFFQQVLRAFAREVGLQGGYEVELNSDYIVSAAIDRMFYDLDGQSPLYEWLAKYADERIHDENSSWNIRDKSDIPNLAKQLSSEIYKQYRDELSQWSLDDYKKYIEELNGHKVHLRNKIAQVAQDAREALAFNNIEDAYFSAKWIKVLDILSDAQKTDKEFDKAVESFETKYATPEKWFAKTNIKKTPWTIESLVDKASPILQTVADALKECMVELRSVVHALKHIYSLGVLSIIDDNVKAYEREHNTLLLSKTPEILSGLINESDAPFIYEKVGTHVAHYMIDEFQDTSRLQWRNFKPLIDDSLASNNENLIVGDVKQSIYRFRNSDWRLLQEGLDGYNYNLLNTTHDINRRSCANVVAFNNTFFMCAAELLHIKLTDICKSQQVPASSIEPLVKEIYSSVAQKVWEKHYDHTGHIDVHILRSDDKKEFTDEVHRRVIETVINLLEKGYKQGDIAFLVRNRTEGSQIVNLLLNIGAESVDEQGEAGEANARLAGWRNNLRVMSDESLIIANARPVQLILGILRYLQNPQFPLNRVVLAYEFNLLNLGSLDNEESLKSCFGDTTEEEPLLPLSADLMAFIEEISSKSLFEICEMTIEKFRLQEQPENIVYIEAFQDIVIDYCRNHSADVYSFLRWWDDTGSSASVKSPEDIDAIKVITIHKSKGLEFPVVIIPYATWHMAHPSNSIKWYVPDRNPFNALPVLPLGHQANSSLKKTIFARQFFEEVVNEYIDNLNVTYVAFTRAVQELIVYTFSETKKENSYKVSDLIEGVMNMPMVAQNANFETMDLSAHVSQDEKEIHFEVGADWSPARFKKSESDKKTDNTGRQDATSYEKSEPIVEKEVEYRVVLPSENRLRQRTSGPSAAGSRRDYGTLMHEILSDIYTADDIKVAVQRRVREGRLKQAEANSTEQKIRNFIAHPNAQRWFSPEVRAVNETDILKEGESANRPDRIVMDGDRVTVVDYKFGMVENPDYLKKVETYMQLLRDMGYNHVEGCIWYVEKEKFVAVE